MPSNLAETSTWRPSYPPGQRVLDSSSADSHVGSDGGRPHLAPVFFNNVT